MVFISRMIYSGVVGLEFNTILRTLILLNFPMIMANLDRQVVRRLQTQILPIPVKVAFPLICGTVDFEQTLSRHCSLLVSTKICFLKVPSFINLFIMTNVKFN